MGRDPWRSRLEKYWVREIEIRGITYTNLYLLGVVEKSPSQMGSPKIR